MQMVEATDVRYPPLGTAFVLFRTPEHMSVRLVGFQGSVVTVLARGVSGLTTLATAEDAKGRHGTSPGIGTVKWVMVIDSG